MTDEKPKGHSTLSTLLSELFDDETGGTLDEDASAALRDLMLKLREQSLRSDSLKVGTFTLTLKVGVLRDKCEIAPEFATKAPKKRATVHSLWTNSSGAVFTEDPKQLKLRMGRSEGKRGAALAVTVTEDEIKSTYWETRR